MNMKNLQTMKQSVQKGFTLIELMIVVAIIGILAAIAIPAYTDYTIKSRVSEGASLVGSAKTAFEVYWSENGTVEGPTGNLITAFDLSLCDTAANCTTWVSRAEYVSSVIISGVLAAPYFEVQYKTSNALGTASGTCVNYFPNWAEDENIEWEVRAELAYTTAGGNATEVATCSLGDATPNKYKPKV